MFTEKSKITGTFRAKVFEGDALIREIEEKNLVVNGGLDALSKFLSNVSVNKYLASMSAGTSGTAPTPTDTAIAGAVNKAITITPTYPTVGTVLFDLIFDYGDANGITIQEFGIFCQDGTLFARRTVAPIVKTISIRVEIQWLFTF